MEIRRTNLSNLTEVISIYRIARKYMAEIGNSNQWIDGYPNEKVILNDIENKHHYSCIDNNQLIGCFALIEGDDPTYRKITKGCWLNSQPYAVVHRIAALKHANGIGSTCIEWCLQQHQNIRVDTHKDNTPMQRILLKNGFQYCGIIYNTWGDERLAYHIAVTR